MTLYIIIATALAIYAIALHWRRSELLEKALWVHQSAWGWSPSYSICWEGSLVHRWIWPTSVLVSTPKGVVIWEPGDSCFALCEETGKSIVHESPGIVAIRMLAHVRATERKAKEALQ